MTAGDGMIQRLPSPVVFVAGKARHGPAGHGMAWQAWLGKARLGAAGQGMAWQAWRGAAGLGKVGHGRLGSARQG